MSKEPEDNSIDKLFRASIDNMETEPSDRFWNRAYDGILKNESKAYERKILLWRGVSAVLAVSLVALIGYNVYTNRKVNDIEKQVATIENKQLLAANKESQALSTSANYKSNAANQQLPQAADIQNSTNNVSSGQGNANAGQNNNIILAANNQQPIAHRGVAGTHAQISSQEQQTPSGENVKNFVNQAQEQSDATPAVVVNTNTGNQNKADENNNKIGSNLIYLDQRTPTEDITIPPQDKVDDHITMDVQDNSTVHPINGKSGSDAWVAKKQTHIFRNISLSAFAGPSIYSAMVKDNNTKDGISAEDIKAREQQQLAYTVGVNAGYDLSPKFTLQAGVGYRAYRFYINPSKVYAASGDVSATYPVVTSSGTVNMPYISGYSPAGYDTVATAKGSAIRSYISVPVRMKYNFVHSNKFKVYLAGGGAVNFLAYNYVTIQCQNQWGAENDNIYDINGTSKVNFSYLLGLGAEFKMGNGLSLYIEPSYTGAVTPTAKGTAMTTYSNYFDFTAGVSYHF